MSSFLTLWWRVLLYSTFLNFVLLFHYKSIDRQDIERSCRGRVEEGMNRREKTGKGRRKRDDATKCSSDYQL